MYKLNLLAHHYLVLKQVFSTKRIDYMESRGYCPRARWTARWYSIYMSSYLPANLLSVHVIQYHVNIVPVLIQLTRGVSYITANLYCIGASAGFMFA